MADFDGIIQPSAEWVDIPSLSDTALAKGGTAGTGVMNAQATALAKRTNYLYNYTIQYDQNTGYVGINTPNPSVPLEISILGGGTYSSSSTTVASPYIASKLSQLSNSNNTQSLQSFSVKYGGASWYVGAISNGGYVAPFVFGSRTGATAYSEVARFDANLNFGLGTTTPSNITGYKIVDIRGSSGSFYYGGNSSTSKSFRVGYSASNDALELNAISNNAVMIKTFDASRIFIDNVGTVGINTVTTSGGTGNTAVEGKLIVYQSSSNVPALTVPYPGSAYAGFKLVHQSTNISGASDYIDFRVRPSYSTGIATGPDNTFLRVVNTYPRTNTDLNLNPDGGNVGIGINPSTWTTYKALEISSSGHGIFGVTGQVGMAQNATLNTTWKYSTTGAAARYTQSGGSHVWHRATSGTSDSNITWLESLRIDGATGNIGVKNSSPSLSVDISATDAIRIPVGTTAQQPTPTTSNGGVRINSTTSNLEMCVSNAWKPIGGLLNVQVFKTPGTFTYTSTPGTNRRIIEIQGPGGGGAGAIATTSGQISFGGPGNGGGYGKFYSTYDWSGASIVIPNGGYGGTAGANGSAALLSTSIQKSTFTYTASSGGAGVCSSAITAAYAASLSGSPGTISYTAAAGDIMLISAWGAPAEPCVAISATMINLPGAGGSEISNMSFSSTWSVSSAHAYGNGGGGVPGAGGYGSVNMGTQSAMPGGQGAPGAIIIWEYA